ENGRAPPLRHLVGQARERGDVDSASRQIRAGTDVDHDPVHPRRHAGALLAGLDLRPGQVAAELAGVLHDGPGYGVIDSRFGGGGQIEEAEGIVVAGAHPENHGHSPLEDAAPSISTAIGFAMGVERIATLLAEAGGVPAASAFALAGHDHDARYMRRVY